MQRLLSLYYLATPFFAALDLLTGFNVRTAAFADSPLRWLYYAGAFGCGLLAAWRPSLTPIVGMAESAASILLIMLAILLPVWNMLGDAESATTPLGPAALANAAISGLVFVFAFYGSQAALMRRKTVDSPT